MNSVIKTKIPPAEVIQRWKIGKTRLYDLMNDGKLSYEKMDNGKRQLELSELIRVLGEPVMVKSEQTLNSSNQSAVLVQTLQSQLSFQESMSKDYIESLKSQLAIKDSQLLNKDDQIKQLINSLEQTTLLLKYLPEETPGVIDSIKPLIDSKQKSAKRRGLFTRIW